MRKRIISFLLALTLTCTLLPPALAVGTSNFDLSPEGLSFILKHETFRSTAYQANGTWYIGYGTTCEQNAYPNGITEEEAAKLLREKLQSQVKTVNQYLEKYNITANQPKFDALVSFTYSLGSSWTNPTYRISNYLIDGLEKQTDVEIVDAMAVWCHSNGKVKDNYLQRRIDEARLLLYGDYSSKDSPSFVALILDKNGGTLENDTVCYPADTTYGSLPTVTRSGYRFNGWFTQDGKKLTEDQKATQHLNVKAQWVSDDTLAFADVKSDDWFYPYIFDLTKSGVINGRTPTSFAPSGTLTFGEATKLILLAAGYDAQKATGPHWASGYISFAVKSGFLSSNPSNFDASINRLQIAQLAAKALKLAPPSKPSPFADTTDSSVLSLYEAGILQGTYENNRLLYKPSSNITRAEISAIIWRMERYKPETPDPKPDPKPDPEPDHSNQILYKDKWLDILPNVPKNTYDPKLFYQSDGYTYYKSNAYRYETGVDVSVYQGEIDWYQVKDAGIDYAIIRAGGRGWSTEGSIYADKNFQKNIEGALKAGLKVGVYFFSQAISVEEAIEEARFTLDQIKGYDVTYPVVFDWEIVSNKEARTSKLDAATLSAAANAFCREVEKAGHHPMIYFNSPCGYLRYDLSKIVQYDFWYAQYYSVPTFYYGFDMWQYTSSGQVPGIPGKVDLNLYWLPKS